MKSVTGRACFILTAVLFVASSNSWAASSTDLEELKVPVEQSSQSICIQELDDTTELERRGCCSWHGGVCGCEGGRALCCDGTLSPSCGC